MKPFVKDKATYTSDLEKAIKDFYKYYEELNKETKTTADL
jgi:hypothetical protein